MIKDILKHYFGYSTFRYPQEEIIQNILQKKDTIAILPTGAGKSITYQIPALIFDGITIVITPLISLMEDQVFSLRKRGIEAAYLNSNLSKDKERGVYEKLCIGKIKIIYLAPERINNLVFQYYIQKLKISLIAIDEAHTILWADRFRSAYGQLGTFIQSLPQKPAILAVTATATPYVKEYIQKSLYLTNPQIFFTSVDREELFYRVIEKEHKMRFLIKYLKKHSFEKGIIYCLTRKSVEKLNQDFQTFGIKSYFYHGGSDQNIKYMQQEEFRTSTFGVMIATNAFGMGIDIPDIRFVIEYELPATIEDLAQQMGRASRDGKGGEGIVLFSFKDIKIVQFFINNLASKETKNQQKKELNKVIEYCTTKRCRHQFIASYFGETKAKCKNRCDNC